MTRLQSVTLQVARGRQKKSSRHCAYDVGSGGSVLADVGSSSQLRDVVGAEVAALLIARSSRSFVFLGRPDPPQRYTLPSHDPLFANTEQLPYRSDRGGGRYVYSTNLLL
ncbi:hypothetical protein TNCV_4185971 [Trichonephila clavipes]|nr:hypothetical protein TNCV_4185971 [Trichonephila clavipes]